MNASRYFPIATIIASATFIGQPAFAQSGQYQRAKKADTAPKAPPAAPEDVKNNAPAEGAPQGDDLNKKVDITDLEQKYWVPKDTEFKVVQNRTYTKENRFALTLSGGPLINDQYSKAGVYALTGSYYFNEKMSAELTYMNYDIRNNVMTDEFINRFAVAPDFNKENNYIGASFSWIPIYAKLALLDKQIVYFDLSFSAGLGVTTYEQQMTNAPSRKSQTPTLSIDIAQHFFINKNFALRVELRNHIFTWDVLNSRNGDVIRNTNTTSNTVLFGLTYYH
jgi:outer membrane beta-barrel protein